MYIRVWQDRETYGERAADPRENHRQRVPRVRAPEEPLRPLRVLSFARMATNISASILPFRSAPPRLLRVTTVSWLCVYVPSLIYGVASKLCTTVSLPIVLLARFNPPLRTHPLVRRPRSVLAFRLRLPIVQPSLSTRSLCRLSHRGYPSDLPK